MIKSKHPCGPQPEENDLAYIGGGLPLEVVDILNQFVVFSHTPIVDFVVFSSPLRRERVGQVSNTFAVGVGTPFRNG